jgi:casein kinase II subunit alpha
VQLYRVKREIKILQDLAEGPNIVTLVDVARNSSDLSPAIVTEYVEDSYYRDLYASFTDSEVRFYVFQLLRALEFAHNKTIMHRDIKPHNIVIDHEKKKVSTHLNPFLPSKSLH